MMTASGTPLPGPGRPVAFVRLEALSEINGQPWISVAEFNLLDATGAPIARAGWKASADSAGVSEQPGYAIDGDVHSMWHTAWDGAAPPPPHSLTVSLGAPVRVSGFRVLPRQDNTINGGIARYRFYVSEDGSHWGQPVAEGDLFTPGEARSEKTVVFAQQTVNRAPALETPIDQKTMMGRSVRFALRAIDADGDPLAYEASDLPAGLAMGATNGVISGTPIVPGSYLITVSVKDNKGLAATSKMKWEVLPAVAEAAASAAPAGTARFVRLEQVSEIHGGAWASVAEFDLLDAQGQPLPRKGWLASADSAGANEAAANAIDDDKASIWHTQWDGSAPPPPHSLIVDLGEPKVFKGFRYTPRQDNTRNGTIAKFRFYLSQDGIHWGQPVAEGDFSTLGEATQAKTVSLK